MALLLAAVPTQAAGDASPNTLTAEETAEGWVLLFDGQTTSGWRIDGDAEVKDGALLLGGARATRARFPRPLGCPFNLRFEYQVQVPAAPGTSIWCRLQDRGLWARGGEAENLPGAGAGWVEVVMAATYDSRKDYYEQTSKSRNLLDGKFDRRGSSSSKGLGPPRHAKDLWLDVPAGAKIAVRGVKFKGDPIAETTPVWVWLLPLEGLLLVVVGALAYLIRRRRRRAAAGDPSQVIWPNRPNRGPRGLK
jgi:hypothetical protein